MSAVITLAALMATTAASANVSRTEAIDPGTPVNGMLVVQGLEREADVSLFTPFCDPIVARPGRATRMCSALPPWSRRIFVGYGIWGVSRKIVDRAWNKRSWALWIDGQRVSLGRFGTSDRWIPSLAEANGRRVLLREWSIILIGAKGRHTIRYSSRLPQGVNSTTWKFTVLAH